MTNNLKCPFCGGRINTKKDIPNSEPIRAGCINPKCPWFMWAFPWEIWQALIDGKKAQEELDHLKRSINNGSGIKN